GETAIDKRIFFSASDSNSIAYMNQYGFSNTDNVGKRGSINYLNMEIEDNDNYTSTRIIPEGINIARRYGSITVSSLEDITGTFTQTLQSKSGIIATTDDIKLQSYTVGTLPTGTIGHNAYVTDATAPTYLGGLIGGGSVVCPVFYNGTTWVSH
ncbi:hypothetical protein NJT12_24410, partial [Flavobacterium sp. AC]